jgi:putative transposase
VKQGWHRTLDVVRKIELLHELDGLHGRRRKKLDVLGIPTTTYYRWQKAFQQSGGDGLVSNSRLPGYIWNRLTPEEYDRVLTIARNHPDLSCRLLAIKITDDEAFSISPATVYRILKQNNLITPRPLSEMPAQKEWQHKTQRPDEIWQCDATHYFVVGWGIYKQITVQDDYSRYPLAWDVKPDETAFSISEVMERALDAAHREGHLINGERPMLLSDNGPGFTSELLAGYLTAHGIPHIFGHPYHPQTQGKIERFHRSIKEKVLLLVYCSPEELKRAVDDAIIRYAHTPHTALRNVSPRDVYLGRRDEILRDRAAKKDLTVLMRRLYNLAGANGATEH